MRRQPLGRAVVFAAVALLLAVQGAWADNLVADGDAIAPIASASMAFGTVCSASTTSKPVVLAIRRNGNGTNVFKNGSSASVTVTSVVGSGLSASGGGTIAIPAAWDSLANNTLTSTLTATVQFVAGAPGSFNGTVNFAATGVNSSNTTLTRTDSMGVTATVVTCDSAPPILSLPAPITAEATSASGAVVTFAATATDANPANPVVTCVPTSGSTFALGTTTVNCSATDAVGNTGTGSFTVTIVDTTPPSIIGTPSPIAAEATGASGATVSYTAPTATDLVDGAVAVTCLPASGSTFALGVTPVTCSATDAHSNTATTGFNVTVSDTTAPILAAPAPIQAEATSPAGATVGFSASAFDIVDGAITPTCLPVSGSTFPLGTTSVTCTATDAAGNSTSGSFSVTVVDTTPPSVSVPAPITAEATGPSGAVVGFSAFAVDIVDGTISAICSPASGTTFALGTTSVTCSATDTYGNTGSASFSVTVVDTTPPSLTLPADQLLEATGPGGAVATFSASASDLVDGSVAVTCVPVSGTTFPLGITTVDCSATDAHSNVAMGSFTIEVEDTTPPALALPAPIVAEATSAAGATASFSATALDIVDGAITPTCLPVSGSTFPLGTTSVTCTATDAAGNSTSGSFSVTVVDTTPPSVTVPAPITAEATGPSGAAVGFSALAFDIVDGAITPTCLPVSGSTFPLGTTSVTCTATDVAGNSTSASISVTVVDTTPPSVTVPAPITAEATGPSGAAVSFTASAFDVVDGALTPLCSPASGTTFALGTTSVTCSVTDTHANTGSASFSVTVVDTTAPAITTPANITTGPTSISGATVTYSGQSAVDIVDGPLTATCTPPSGSSFGFGTTTVTCTATDAAGNTGSGNFTITVNSFTFQGFFQPVDMNAVNTVKGGSTVPVKWRLFGAGGVEFTSVATVASGWPKAQKLDCGTLSNLPEDAIETVATGGTSLRYDSTGGQFVYNWQTPKQPGTCWRLDVKFVDGSTKSASFKLK